MGHVMRNPVYAICEQQRRRSAYASAEDRLSRDVAHIRNTALELSVEK